MKTYNNTLAAYEFSVTKEPRFVVQVSWDFDDTDYTYFTSSSDAAVPTSSPIDRVDNAVLSISGVTQQLNPDTANSTIGTVKIDLLDVNDNTTSPVTENQVTSRINTKLTSGNGLRGKIVRVYVGYEDMAFSNYDLRLTYIVDSVSYNDKRYSLTLSDIQRETRHKIFTPQETTLNSSIDENTLVIPVTSIDTDLFQAITHGADYAVRPGETVGYIKIGDEVICHEGGLTFDTTNGWYITALERGALNTVAAKHTVSDGTEDNRKPKIKEHIYFEGAASKTVYALLTGLVYNTRNYYTTEAFDFTEWTAVNSPTVAASAQATPVGWGTAYTITDAVVSPATNQYITTNQSTNYTHGNIWTAGIFVSKTITTSIFNFRIRFFNGAAGSFANVYRNNSTGAITTGTTNATIDDYDFVDWDDNWWYVYISASSTTTGTTTVGTEIIPGSVAADSGAVTVFGASLVQGSNVGMTALPLHWHLGITNSFVSIDDFYNIGADLWDIDTDDGRPLRIENPGTQDGKKYIEKEALLWMGCYMPIYSTGELGLRRMAGVLSDSSYIEVLDKYNIVSYSDLQHDMRSVINDIRVNWNWVDAKEEYTKTSLFIDETSIAKHGYADQQVFDFKAVHVGKHTDESLLSYFDILRDRYSGPALRLSLSVLPSMSHLEVGDVVYVYLSQIIDFNSGTGLSRPFEIQQITTDWTTGAIKLRLFASSQAAGALTRTTLNSVLLDTFYTQAGTDLGGSPSPLTIVAGAVTVGGTLTGSATDIDSSAAIYYYDGDLTINAGVTVNVTENVQLRVKGTLTINGAIDGVGAGATGGAATTQFVGGGTTATAFIKPDINAGELGYFGRTQSPAALSFMMSPTGSTGTTVQACDRVWPSSEQFPTYKPIAYPSYYEALDNVPFFQLANDQQTNTVKGYPKDLRGTAGSSGIPLIRKENYSATQQCHIKANGGAGGNGGAGLLIICRGLEFGGYGEIDLSGGDSSAGTSTTASAKTFYGGSGAPGAPGALVVLCDGQYTNPDITTNEFVANYGAVGVPGATTSVEREETDSTDGVLTYTYIDGGTGYSGYYTWKPFSVGTCSFFTAYPYSSSVYVGPNYEGIHDQSCTDSALRYQYIPEDETPVYQAGDHDLFNERVPWEFFQPFRFEEISGAANNEFGTSTAVQNKGIRFAVGRAQLNSSNNTVIHIFNNIYNPNLEQTLNPPSGASISSRFGRQLFFDSAATRLITAEDNITVSGNTNAGQVHIYSRSGSTWSVEQTISEPTPAASAYFGRAISCNDVADKLLILANAAPATTLEAFYYDRSGTTWTQRTGPTAPSGTFQGEGLALSKLGDHCLVPASLYSTDGGVHVYDRNGTSWTYVDTLTPISDTTYAWGAYQSAISYDGSVIIISGPTNAASPASRSDVAVYKRIGTTFKLLQILSSPDNGATDSFGYNLLLSDDGLTLVVNDADSNEIFIYRRSNTEKAFSEYQRITTSESGGSLTGGFGLSISQSGKLMIVGNRKTTATYTESGIIYIWQTLAD